MTFKRKKLALLGTVAVAGLAYAAIVTQIQLKPEITLSEGGNGHKPKIQRASDGTLVSAFGDSPASVGDVYDTKGDVDRPARDIYVKYCKPSATKTCDLATDWTKATTAFGTDGNVSNQATKSSMSSAWDDDTPGVLKPYLGDTDKPNIKTSGPVMVLTWVGKYCPNGDLQAVDVDGDVNTNQRAVRYLERKSRVIPFSCTWAAYSTNNGQTWAAPVQLSNGERDAKQDASFGSYDSVSKTGKLNISWQEDPKGLQLGESDGPGDGASGANVSNGTDVWYAYGNIDMNSLTDKVVIAKNTAPVVGKEDRAFGFRLTDNYTKDGIGGTDAANPVFNALGTQVDKDTIESGGAGAARPNIAMVSNQTVLAYEETKGSEGLDEGKFIRYHTFSYNTVPTDAAGKAGCIISNPQKNARRVRFLTQSAAAATGVTAPAVPSRSGVNIAIFWKEGIYDKGGPSDIVLRRGMVDPAVASNVQSGLKTTQMVPAVDAACAALDYTASQTLSNLPGDNISSRADRLATLGVTGLTDSTETDYYENALAHRGVLRGDQLWVGYKYTPDLVAMWNQDTNYNFWLRKFTFDGSSNSVGGSWGLPFNVSNETDTNVNVREPRIFGTPASNTGAGFCDNADPTLATDPTFCQNADVVYVMWGSQENVNPFNIEGGADLGVWGSASLDGGANFLPKVRISEEMGSLFNDDESAFETQPVTRPDGTRFYAMFNTETFDPITKAFISAAARYRSGDIVQVDDGTVPGTTPSTDGGGGGCTAANGKAPFDPMLPLFAALGLIGWGLRRARRS
jgi:hypothetical protein